MNWPPQDDLNHRLTIVQIYGLGTFFHNYGMYPISKGLQGVRKIQMKGSYNFLGAVEDFAPWIFLIRSSSEDMLQKIPEIIEKVSARDSLFFLVG